MPWMPKRPQMSRSRRIIWRALVILIVGAGLLISAAEVGMAEWLNAKMGWVPVIAGCGVIFAALVWIASRLDN
jgi:hypothetical protein